MPGHFFGCIGQMMPAAVGAVIGSGMKPAILMDGDASTMMHIGDFDTMVRYKVPLLIFCMNNECLGAEYYKLEAHNMKVDTSCIPTADLGAVARAFGGLGRRFARGLRVCGIFRLGYSCAAHLHHAGLGDAFALGWCSLALALCLDFGFAAGRGL